MHLRFGLLTVGLALALFLGMLLFLELGRRLAVRQTARHGTAARTGVGKADAPVYALLALLIGFTFSGAASRFDHRRELIAQQINSISTGWQRIDLLPSDLQPPIRTAYVEYVDVLIAEYSGTLNLRNALREPPEVAHVEDSLWARAVAACVDPRGEKARMLLLPALNELFGLVEAERFARRLHPPLLIFGMLGLAALASALFAGYGLASAPIRNWIYILGIAATVASALYVVIELEYPRRGLIRVDEMDQALRDARAALK